MAPDDREEAQLLHEAHCREHGLPVPDWQAGVTDVEKKTWRNVLATFYMSKARQTHHAAVDGIRTGGTGPLRLPGTGPLDPSKLPSR